MGFPWDDVLAVGLGLLRLSPTDFWSLTTREFAALARGLASGTTEPIRRSDFHSLMEAFPDAPSQEHIK